MTDQNNTICPRCNKVFWHPLGDNNVNYYYRLCSQCEDVLRALARDINFMKALQQQDADKFYRRQPA